MSTRSLRLLMLYLLAVLIPFYCLYAVIQPLSQIPSLDYWTAANQLLSTGGLVMSWDSLFLRLNEHLIPITGFIYALNIKFFAGNNISLIYVALLTCFIQIALLYKSIVFKKQCRISEQLFLLYALSVFIFSISPYSNWFEGFSAIHWQFANLGVVVALYFFRLYEDSDHKKHLVLGLFSASCATLAYSSAYPLWIVLTCYLLFLRSGVLNYVILLGFGIPIVLFGYILAYGFGFEVPSHPTHNPVELTTSITKIIEYTLIYLGDYFYNARFFFLHDYRYIVASGLFGVLLFLFLSLYSVFKRKQESYLFIGLGLFSLGNALLTVIIRGSFGLDMIISPRFKSVSMFFWLALFILTYQFAERFFKNSLSKTIVRSIFFILISSHLYISYICFQSEVYSYSQIMRVRDSAALSYKLGMFDEKIFVKTITHNKDQMTDLKKKLAAAQHVPFQNKLSSCKNIHSDRFQKIEDIQDLSLGISIVNGRRVIVQLAKDYGESLCLLSKENSIIGEVRKNYIFRAKTKNKKKTDDFIRYAGYVSSGYDVNQIKLSAPIIK